MCWFFFCVCVCVWIVKGADPSLALLSLDKPTCWGPLSPWDPSVFPVTHVHCCWKQAPHQDWWRRRCGVCGASQSAQYPSQLCGSLGCGHWLAVVLLTASVYSAENGSGLGVGLGHERSYMWYKPWFCDSRFRNPTVTRPCLTVLGLFLPWEVSCLGS